MNEGVDGDDQRSTQRRPMRRHPTERVPGDSDASRQNAQLSRARGGDPVRSKILYGGALALAAAVLVALGLAALFDVSFWAALGIAALIGLGLAMLLAVLVG
ncbi:MAG: hypothetical protein M3313_13085 [Actinomycetota bacterium]|nr:hypothetical protein [Actinomycetota bacterium]